MNTSVQYLYIPSFPVEPELGKFILVERGYHSVFNELTKIVVADDDTFISLPSIEHTFYPECSKDDFFTTILPGIDNLYSFLDDAVVLHPMFINSCSVNRIYCHPSYLCVDNLITYGVMVYTGRDIGSTPVFAYASLVGDSLDQILDVLELEIPNLKRACQRIAPKKSNLFVSEFLQIGSDMPVSISRYATFYLFRENENHKWAFFNYDAKGGFVLEFTNRKFNCSVCFSPTEFALYSAFVYWGEYVSRKDILLRRSKFYLQALLPVWRSFLRQNGVLQINADYLSNHISAIEDKMHKAFHSVESGIEYQPFAISYKKDDDYPDGAWGILISTMPSRSKYYIDFKTKIAKAIELRYSDSTKRILVSCPVGTSGLFGFPQRSKVEVIANGAFASCSSITEVILPKSVTTIHDRAFTGCTSLKTVTFNSPDVQLGSDPFHNCPRLECFVVPAGSAALKYTLNKKYPHITIKNA